MSSFNPSALLEGGPGFELPVGSMPSFSRPFIDDPSSSVFPLGMGFGNENLAGKYLDNSMVPQFRYGVGGVMSQPDNGGMLPGFTTTLPTSPESPAPIPEGVDPTTAFVLRELRGMKKDGNEEWKEQADYIFDKRREEAERANKMGQWNTVLGSFIKDVPKALSESARRRNMYLGDMLTSQADARREAAVGLRQAMASMPNAPARNYIRI